MNKIYLTADLQLGHNKADLLHNRGFSFLEDYEETLIENEKV